MDNLSKMQRIKLLLVCLITGLSLFAQTGDFIIRNVSILKVEEGIMQPGMTVIVRKGEIAAIFPQDRPVPLQNLTVIDGKGKYLVPGLAEMHAHIPTPVEGDDALVKETLFLYLSNGITTIRGMLGAPYHLQLREAVHKGDMLGPRIFTSSPSLNGNSIPDVETAKLKVTQYKNDGYDFLKLHPGLKLDVFNAITQTAKSVGIPFSGHVSILVGIDRALDAQYSSIDHLDGYAEGLVPASLQLDPASNGFFGFNFTDQMNVGLAEALAKKTKTKSVWVVPTQSLFDRWLSPDDPQRLATAPEMQYMDPKTRYAWVQTKTGFIKDKAYSAAKYARYRTARYVLLQALHNAGVNFLLGSDAPQVFNVPGFSIQHEMQGLASAGLPNADIIRSGSINPAIFFNQKNQFGSIEAGKAADLVLLNANPLEDISSMAKIAGVMVRGQWLSREKIDSELQKMAQKYAKE